MTHGIRLLVLGSAIGVNGVALAAVHSAMGEIQEREKLALQQPVRIVVVGRRSDTPILAIENCPAPRVL